MGRVIFKLIFSLRVWGNLRNRGSRRLRLDDGARPVRLGGAVGRRAGVGGGDVARLVPGRRGGGAGIDQRHRTTLHGPCTGLACVRLRRASAVAIPFVHPEIRGCLVQLQRVRFAFIPKATHRGVSRLKKPSRRDPLKRHQGLNGPFVMRRLRRRGARRPTSILTGDQLFLLVWRND